MNPNGSPVSDLASTPAPNTTGGPTLAQGFGGVITASELEAKNPSIKQTEFRGDPTELGAVDRVRSLANSFGLSGTQLFAGFLSGLDYNTSLQGRLGLLKYDEMRKSDATVQWSLQVIKLPIRQANFHLQPASDDIKDREIADFVEWNLLERINWKSFIRELLTYQEFGFYLGEKDYITEQYQPKPITVKPELDDDDGEVQTIELPTKPMVILRAIENRLQTTIFRWQQGDGTPGVTQITAQGTFNIPENRLFLITREREGNNYTGVSILRSSYRHWYIKDALYKFSAVAAERQGVGVLGIEYLDENPSQSTRDAAVEAAQSLRANAQAYVEIPHMVKMEFMDMKAKTTYSAGADIEHQDRQIMKNVGAAFMEMGATRQTGSTGGSRSASGDQAAVYEQAIEAIADEVEEAINNMVIRQLVDLNYTDIVRFPRLVHDKIGEADLEGYAKYISELMDSGGLTPDPDMEQYLRERGDLPDLPQQIRANWAVRQRAQANTVPENQPGDPIDDLPASGKGGDPEDGRPQQGNGKPNQKPNTKPQPDQMVRSVEKFYNNLGKQLDGIRATRP